MDTLGPGAPYTYPGPIAETPPRAVTFAPGTTGEATGNVMATPFLDQVQVSADTIMTTPPATPTRPQYSMPSTSTPPLTPTRQYGDQSPLDVSEFSFSDFLGQLEDYSPTLPDSVANHYLHLTGFESSDPRMSRLISIAAQKFISDIVNDAFTHCKLKGQIPVGKTKVKDKKYVLTMEDLVPVMNDYAITLRKPPYFV